MTTDAPAGPVSRRIPEKPLAPACDSLATASGRPCRLARKVAEFNPGSWMDFYSVRYWVLDGCGRHVGDLGRAVLDMIEEYEKYREKAAKAVRDMYHRAMVAESDLLMADAEVTRLTQQHQDAHVPACWSWDVPGPRLERVPATLGELEAWQDGRCAVCGIQGPALQIDHDHWSGLIRGFLDRDCNQGEGHGDVPMTGRFAAYRQKHPARMFGLVIPYASRGRHWRG